MELINAVRDCNPEMVSNVLDTMKTSVYTIDSCGLTPIDICEQSITTIRDFVDRGHDDVRCYLDKYTEIMHLLESNIIVYR